MALTIVTPKLGRRGLRSIISGQRFKTKHYLLRLFVVQTNGQNASSRHISNVLNFKHQSFCTVALLGKSDKVRLKQNVLN